MSLNYLNMKLILVFIFPYLPFVVIFINIYRETYSADRPLIRSAYYKYRIKYLNVILFDSYF